MSTRHVPRKTFLSRFRRTTIAFVLGLLFIATAGYIHKNNTSFLADAEETTGTVVRMIERTTTTTDGDGEIRQHRAWHPVVQFTVDKQTVEFEAKRGTSQSAHHVGDSVTVAYHPADPRAAKIVNFTQLYRDQLVIGLIGVALIGFAVIARIVARRRTRLAG